MWGHCVDSDYFLLQRKTLRAKQRKWEVCVFLTVFVLSDALQWDPEEGRVRVVVPDQQLRSSGDVHTGSVEDTGPGEHTRHHFKQH